MLPNKIHPNLLDISRKRRFKRVSKYLQNIIMAVLLLFITLCIGIFGFVFIDDYTLQEAFYMTIVTLSTVGYGEVKPLSEAGQLFASFLIIFNLGIFAYAISVISTFIIEGELRLFLKDYKVYKKIQKLRNHTIVCGFGRHGHQISDELTKSDLPFVVIEPDPSLIEDLRDHQFLFLEGDATQDQVLLEAGIEHAKAIVVTYGEDAFNVYTVLTARQLNPRLRIITRASDHNAEKKLLRAGADYVVLSEVIGGFYMATLIHQPNVVEFFNIISNMGDVTINFKEVEYSHLKQEFKDKSIRDLNFRQHTGVNIIGVRHKDGHYSVNPGPDVKIHKGMSLVILGDINQLQAFETLVID